LGAFTAAGAFAGGAVGAGSSSCVSDTITLEGAGAGAGAAPPTTTTTASDLVGCGHIGLRRCCLLFTIHHAPSGCGYN
jgi:hypothetical protein